MTSFYGAPCPEHVAFPRAAVSQRSPVGQVGAVERRRGWPDLLRDLDGVQAVVERLPALSSRRSLGEPPLLGHASTLGPVRVALFVTCLTDTLVPETGIALVRLLERLGHEVEFPRGQTCCGQMHLNTGYRGEASDLARRFVRVFAEAEAIVSPSASCVGTVREAYPELAEGDPSLERELAALAPRVFELTELLVDRLGVEDVGAAFPHRVAYHPTCHSLRVLRLGDRPIRLLRAVRGLELVDLPRAAECCGFGGTFAVKNADTSVAILADKVRDVLDTRANVCTAADNSCLLHVGGALSRLRAGVRTAHLAEILAPEAE
jgi:L-lactate dehydrogenase complex protein LldE